MFLPILTVILLAQIQSNYGNDGLIDIFIRPPDFEYTVKAVCLMAGNRKRGILYANTKTVDGKQMVKLDRAKVRHCHRINFTFWRGNEKAAKIDLEPNGLAAAFAIVLNYEEDTDDEF